MAQYHEMSLIEAERRLARELRCAQRGVDRADRADLRPRTGQVLGLVLLNDLRAESRRDAEPWIGVEIGEPARRVGRGAESIGGGVPLAVEGWGDDPFGAWRGEQIGGLVEQCLERVRPRRAIGGRPRRARAVERAERGLHVERSVRRRRCGVGERIPGVAHVHGA